MRNNNKPKGNFIIMIVVIIGVSVTVIAALYSLVIATSKAVAISSADQRAFHIAEAGVDHAVWCLNHPSNCGASFSGETRSLVGGEFVSTVTTLSSSSRQIDVTAFVPSQASPTRSVTLRATIGIDSTTISFNYGVQVGIGGLKMLNNAQIIGNVYSNGSIEGANGATITGDVYVATGMILDESWEIKNQDEIFGQKNGSCDASIIDVAQSFKPSDTQDLSMISVYMKKIGNPADISMHIVADNAGNPDSTILSTGTLNSSLVTSTYNWVNVTFPSPTTLTANDTYWMIFDASCQVSKYWSWGKDSNNGFGNGIAKTTDDLSASPTWADAIGDMNFRLYLGGQPTQIGDMTVNGDTHANIIDNTTIGQEAYYQTITGSTVGGATCPNINCHPGSNDPAVQPLPVSDGNIQDWELEALEGGTLVGDQNITTDQTIGPIKIEGNLTVDGGSTITIAGPIWVEGNITFDNNSIIQLDPNYGTGSSVIIADDPSNQDTKGIVKVQNGADFLGSGSNSSYVMVLSTHSSPTTHAIDLSNNTTAAIFYAHQGSINLANNVDLKEVTGYKIIMTENATITYESGLANASFTSGPGASWAIVNNSWRRL